MSGAVLRVKVVEEDEVYAQFERERLMYQPAIPAQVEDKYVLVSETATI